MARELLPEGPVRDLMADLGRFIGARNLSLPVAGGKGDPRIEWRVENEGSRSVLVARMALRLLERNIQQTVPSAPMYAFAVAYWSNLLRQPLDVRVELVKDGAEATDGSRLHHRRRALFLLRQMSQLFSERNPEHPVQFGVESEEAWEWPPNPWFTTEDDRGEAEETDARERTFELSLCSGTLAEQATRTFPEPVMRFNRQFPLTLFNGSPKEARGWKAWTPHGRSAMDVWATSPDGKTFHELELKADDNEAVGGVSEALTYSGLVEALKAGAPAIQGDSDTITAVKDSERRVVWLVAPGFHPLVRAPIAGAYRSPVEWIDARLRRAGVSFRLLPVELESSRWKRWKTEELLPK